MPSCCFPEFLHLLCVPLAGIIDKLKAAMEDSAVPAREGAIQAFSALAASAGPTAEPYLLTVLPSLLERLADKVHSNPLRMLLHHPNEGVAAYASRNHIVCYGCCHSACLSSTGINTRPV